MSFYYNLSQGGSILLVTLLYDMCYVLSILGLMGRVNKDHLVLAACWTLTIITIRWTGKKAYVQVQDLHQFRLLNVKNPYAIFGALAFALKWLYDPIHDQAVIFAFNFALLKGHRNICAQLGHRTLDLFSLSRLSRPFVYNLTFSFTYVVMQTHVQFCRTFDDSLSRSEINRLGKKRFCLC